MALSDGLVLTSDSESEIFCDSVEQLDYIKVWTFEVDIYHAWQHQLVLLLDMPSSPCTHFTCLLQTASSWAIQWAESACELYTCPPGDPTGCWAGWRGGWEWTTTTEKEGPRKRRSEAWLEGNFRWVLNKFAVEFRKDGTIIIYGAVISFLWLGDVPYSSGRRVGQQASGGGGGHNPERGTEGLQDTQVQEQIILALQRLREDMRSVMERLEVVEGLAAANVRLCF